MLSYQGTWYHTIPAAGTIALKSTRVSVMMRSSWVRRPPNSKSSQGIIIHWMTVLLPFHTQYYCMYWLHQHSSSFFRFCRQERRAPLLPYHITTTFHNPHNRRRTKRGNAKKPWPKERSPLFLSWQILCSRPSSDRRHPRKEDNGSAT